MTVLVPFVLNAGINFVLGLLIARFLGPEQFGRYAIGAAVLVLVNTVLLDWLRLAAMRFYSQQSRETQPEIRATLDLLVAGITIAVSGLLVAAVVAGVDFRLPTLLVSAAVLAGLGAGLFDYHGAIARARYLDGAYARIVVVKNLLALLLMAGGAWLTRDPAIVLFGSLLSVAASLMSVRRVLADGPISLRAARGEMAGSFLRYGVPLVAGNAIYSLIPLFNRSLLAESYGFAEVGQFSLASDIGLKLFGALGAAIEIVLLREVFRLDEQVGREAALRRIASNVMLVLAIALPVVIGFWIVLPAFERLIVPPSYHGPFRVYMALLLPGFVAITIFQAALYPVFLIAKRTALATIAALVALAVNLGLALLGPKAPETVATAQSAAFLSVLAITAVMAWRTLGAPQSWRGALALGLALGAMTAATWPLRGTMNAAGELVAQIGLGALAYGAVALATDLCGCRSALRQRSRGRAGQG